MPTIPAHITSAPAAPGAGIAFVRSDLANHPPIAAVAARVVPESRRTVLALNQADRAGPSVQTVEHLMSALAGLGITDAIVEVSAPELPIGDGSSRLFVEAIRAAGLADLDGDLDPIIVTERIEMEDGRGGRIAAEPRQEPGLELVYHLDYGPGAPLPAQTARFTSLPGNDDYSAAIAPARTFSTADEVIMLRKMGLFGHLTASEMLVIGPGGPIDNAYRFSDEPARHKVLDMLGDLALAGRPIRGRVTAWKSGHSLNHSMAARLAAAAV